MRGWDFVSTAHVSRILSSFQPVLDISLPWRAFRPSIVGFEWPLLLVSAVRVSLNKEAPADIVATLPSSYTIWTWLVAWNIFYFSIQLGIVVPSDELIFFSGVGWNHQPEKLCAVAIDGPPWGWHSGQPRGVICREAWGFLRKVSKLEVE